MNRRDMLGEMEVHGLNHPGFLFIKAKLITAATEYPNCQQQRTTWSCDMLALFRRPTSYCGQVYSGWFNDLLQ